MVAAVNAGRVPRRFQEELLAGANRLAAGIECVPPPPAKEDEDDESDGKGKKKEKKGKDD